MSRDSQSKRSGSRSRLQALIVGELEDAARLKSELAKSYASTLAEGVKAWAQTLRAGGKILFCGNGGSAADSQHAATELVVRLKRKRRALPAIALTTDSSLLTAAANDLGFDHVFSRQIEALGQKGDLLVAISTSGRSKNILRAADTARRLGLGVTALTGPAPNPLLRRAHHPLAVPHDDTQRIQEAHILFLHILCRQTERLLLSR